MAIGRLTIKLQILNFKFIHFNFHGSNSIKWRNRAGTWKSF